MRLPVTCSADVLSMYSGTLPKLSLKPSFNIMFEQNVASQSCRHKLCLHVGLYGQPLQCHLEDDGSVAQYHDV